MTTVTRTAVVNATPSDVWDVISDLPNMGALSPEATGGEWVKGDGPAVGSVFKGTNASGSKSWSTKATVTRSAPGRGFEIHVKAFGQPVADWAYDLSPAPEGGTVVTESWTDRRSKVFAKVGGVATGVADREAFAGESMEKTLEALQKRFGVA